MRTKAELLKTPDPEAPPPGIRITSGRTKDEIGRVHHADGVWTAFARDADGCYRALGGHPDFAAALSAIPDAPAPEEREVPKAAAPKLRRPTASAAPQPEAKRPAAKRAPTPAQPVAAPAPAVQANKVQASKVQASTLQVGKAQSGKPKAVRSRAA
ncbi:hypothetical protein [Azospirillum canadense]|uniref:hypothetical protein n=1 Tax=Azospirillum canadense TaxID=403962 RepID=UPI0022271A2A|nr:hypothetical protein [Azospirillum canadense]MCW2244227.1 hypothetical protein [Azospirillum canadense]